MAFKYLLKYCCEYEISFIFIFIGNKNCIYNKITTVCTKYAHGRTRYYIRLGEKETECKETTNSETVAAIVKPQTRGQSNKELTKFPRS